MFELNSGCLQGTGRVTVAPIPRQSILGDVFHSHVPRLLESCTSNRYANRVNLVAMVEYISYFSSHAPKSTVNAS